MQLCKLFFVDSSFLGMDIVFRSIVSVVINYVVLDGAKIGRRTTWSCVSTYPFAGLIIS